MKKINILDTAHVIGFLLLMAICVLCSKGVLNVKSFSVQVALLSLFVTLGVSMLCVLVKQTFTAHYASRLDKWLNYLGTITVLYYFGISATATLLPEAIVYAELGVLCLLIAVLVIMMFCGWASYQWKRLRATE